MELLGYMDGSFYLGKNKMMVREVGRRFWTSVIFVQLSLILLV